MISKTDPGHDLYMAYLADNSKRLKAGKARQSWVQWCISYAKGNYAPVIAWHAKHVA